MDQQTRFVLANFGLVLQGMKQAILSLGEIIKDDHPHQACKVDAAYSALAQVLKSQAAALREATKQLRNDERRKN